MRMENNVGQVKPGFYADLLVLDGNPLNDIRIFQDQDRILGVMKGGRFAKRETSLSRAAQPERKAA
jgi:imidazolonepropionase-like amidohydrolase